ncbi:cilia- and flagella-associated protein 100-like isoform X2 [Hypomesus transpacificus]|uniref:cilia- and flagella-associated protein 100-like isoform X2 n=1 Tax=Hypomesus transpacificus TaxID=137520 RepID=UPI001F074466|nr:cilia- and flagella-associated protein 100-like isoform X2 [Hypomesus transpacificus]
MAKIISIRSGKECAGRQESITEVIEPSDSDEEPELYFTDPREMLHILTDLEEQNLSFIQNFQETEEARDEICKTVQLMQNKTANETQVLQQQIDILNNTIQREEEKNSDLELKSKIFSYGEYRADKQDHMLKLLHNKMKEVFKMCGGEVGTQFSTLHMLANIESRMEEVLERLDTLPSENVEAIRTAKEKEKRLMMREEKMEMKKRHHEERLKIAIERATSDSKKQTGRKLMPRSEPSEVKKNKVYVMSSKEQEDALYFFT